MKISGLPSLLLLVAVAGAAGGKTNAQNNGLGAAAQFDPISGKTLLVIGQELTAVRGYRASGCCPTPAGVTAYVGLYDLLNPATAYQGLGIDTQSRPVAEDAEWGGGPTNAYTMARENPGSALVLAVNITENDHPGALSRVREGHYDNEIGQLGEFIKLVQQPVMLRLGYEFDGVWNQGYEDAKRYRKVFRYIVSRLRELGTSGFATVWQASASPVDDLLENRSENIEDWYPGDDVVDWMGLSWFLSPHDRPADTDAYYRSQDSLSDEVLAFARARRKPVMIAEAAPQGYDLSNLTERHISPVWDGEAAQGKQQVSADELWSRWFQPLFDYIDKNRDVIAALAYINTNWDAQPMWGAPYTQGYWGDSRVQQNAEILARWNTELARDVWRHGESNSGTTQTAGESP